MKLTIQPRMNHQRFRWDVRERAPVEHLKRFNGIHPLLVQLLWNRGITDADSLHAFLGAGAIPLSPPGVMRGMTEAVCRLLEARANHESVAV